MEPPFQSFAEGNGPRVQGDAEMSDATVRAGPGGSTEWGPLLEREVELTEIERLLDRACSGEGERVLVEGPAGAGKTRLLETAADAARARGVRVLEASAVELEVEIGYGVARSLLGDALGNTSPARRRALLTGAASLAAPAVWPEKTNRGSPPDPAAVLHGLFWLVSNLAEQGCLLLVVDDVHWADGPSLRFLTYLAHRLSGLPVLLLVASGRAEPAGRSRQRLDLGAIRRMASSHPVERGGGRASGVGGFRVSGRSRVHRCMPCGDGRQSLPRQRAAEGPPERSRRPDG